MEQNIFILIPAYNPDEKLIKLVNELKESGFSHILVIDDGSKAECKPIFKEVENSGCTLVVHEVNKGKGQAIKTGIQSASEIIKESGKEFIGYITADADGQHLTKDIMGVANCMSENKDCLVIGTRNFNEKDIPLRSRFGNKFSSAFFKIVTGVKCTDTQTGLRGIPYILTNLALEEDGSRYEYEMNFLMDAVKFTKMISIPITVIYENNNEGSHFRPIRDSLRIYGRFLKYISCSLISCACDLIFFHLISLFFDTKELAATSAIFISTAIARVLSGTINFTLNKLWCFKNNRKSVKQVIKYMTVFFSNMILSASFVRLLTFIPVPRLLIKCIVDTILFFVSYRLQQNWVFRKKL